MVLLPEKPVDLYVEGLLLKSKASKQMEMVTPDLAKGSFKYKVLIKDSSDATRKMQVELTGIKAGETLTLDLRDFKPNV